MKDRFSRLTVSLALLLLAGSIFGCQGILDAVKGSYVPPEKRVELAEGRHSASWHTDDLNVNYEYVRSGDRMAIAGAVLFDSSMISTFQSSREFHLDLVLIDSEGNLLESNGLVSIGSRRYLSTPIMFQDTFSLPKETAAIAFSYAGEACSGGDLTCTRLWLYPAL
jgi:hypothetical protein